MAHQNEFERRKAAIAQAIQQLADDGYMIQEDVPGSIAELDRMSATDIAEMYRLFVTEA